MSSKTVANHRTKHRKKRCFFSFWLGNSLSYRSTEPFARRGVRIRREEIGRGAPWCSHFLLTALVFREEQAPPLRSGRKRANHEAKRSCPCAKNGQSRTPVPTIELSMRIPAPISRKALQSPRFYVILILERRMRSTRKRLKCLILIKTKSC